MTIVEQILHEAEALPPNRRKEALRVIRSMRLQATSTAGKSARKTLGGARNALRATKGMWKGSTDLPRDTVEASIELRRRLMERN